MYFHDFIKQNFHLEWTGESVELSTGMLEVEGVVDEKTSCIISKSDLETKYLKRRKKISYWTAGVIIKVTQ